MFTLLIVLNSTPLAAAGFNCAKARTAVEKAICNNPQLSNADGQLGKIYSQLSKTPQLKQEQRDWLKRRDQECSTDSSCLLQMYRQRIAELSGKSASFNCTKAGTAVEKAICISPQLSNADGQLGKIYSQLSKTPQLKQEQRDWLKRRDQECSTDSSCLLQMYQQRIAELGGKTDSSMFVMSPNEVYGVVATESSPLNIRHGMGQDTEVVAKAVKGSRLRILETFGTWYQVQLDNGITGYASSEYVSVISGNHSNLNEEENVSSDNEENVSTDNDNLSGEGNNDSSSSWQCGAKRYCSQMSSCAEAEFYLNTCGLQKLDRDDDGIPCESLCQ
jgi:uncharacterized protein